MGGVAGRTVSSVRATSYRTLSSRDGAVTVGPFPFFWETTYSELELNNFCKVSEHRSGWIAHAARAVRFCCSTPPRNFILHSNGCWTR